ncbi:hypothetical protein SUDANB121_00928 [Nocardiopsis dassonvillei]|uniref:phosphotransferase family protein n=1 Tax=Nocardiopsis dassonvillei TaxID=2014 RepID=UPI003F574A3C
MTPHPDTAVLSRTPLSGGTYNTVHLLTHTDGTETVLKTEPPAGQPRMTYEHRLLHTEARVWELARPVLGPLVPEPLHLGPVPDRPGQHRLLLTRLPGVPLEGVRGDLVPGGPAAVRRALGGAVAALHTLTGTAFGYPDRPELTAATWPDAFAAMVDALLADAERTGVALPRPPDLVRRVVEDHRDLLGAVRSPALVHFDLWDGNILVDGAPTRPSWAGSSTPSAPSGATPSPTWPPSPCSATSGRTPRSWTGTAGRAGNWSSPRTCCAAWPCTGRTCT